MFFGLQGIFCICKPYPVAYPEHMRVNSHRRLVKDHRSNHVGGFTPYPRQLHQLLYLARNLAVKVLYQHLRHTHQVFGFVIGVADASYIRKNGFGSCGSQRLGRGVSLKQLWRGKVYPLIGALRA